MVGNPNFVKGNNLGGRTKGIPNKATSKTREAIARFADETVEDFISWIKDIAIDDKKEAAKLYLSAIEYHIPKLARTEVSGVDGEAIEHNLVVEFVKPNDNPVT
jgi:hypothetical protein